MKLLALAILAIVLLAGIARADFVLPPFDLGPINLHSPANGENVTCGALSTQIGSVKGVPVEANVLLSDDFLTVGKWGFGLAAPVGKDSPFKLGAALMPGMKGPVLTLSFRLL